MGWGYKPHPILYLKYVFYMANINKIRVSGNTYNIEDLNAARTITLTQAEYDALQTKDPNVFYIISDSNINYVTSAETQSAITQAVSGKADSSSVYLKSETSGATEISTALADKLDATAYTPTDLSNYYTTAQTDTKISQSVSGKTNQSDFTGHTANTTVHVTAQDKTNWNAKSDFSGSYNDLTDKPTIPTVPTSNTAFTNDAGYLVANDISGKTNQSDFTAHTANTTAHVTQSEKNTWNAKSDFSGNYNDLTNKPTIPTVPTSNTAFTNDAGYLVASDISGKQDVSGMTAYTTTATTSALNNVVTAHTANTTVHVTAQDKTNWNAKSDFSGSYNDLTDKPTIPTVPTSNTAFTNDAGYLVSNDISGKTNQSDFTGHTANTTVHITAAERTSWNAKSDFSGSYNDLTDKPTIPTIPTSNTAFTNDAGYITDSALDDYATEAYVDTGLSNKQDTLESGVSIKTVNNYSLLGSGNINIGGSGSNNVVELTQSEYDALDPKDPSAFYIITDAEGGDLANYMTSAQTQTAINQATSGKTNQSDFTGHTADTSIHVTTAQTAAWDAKSNFSGSYNDLTDKPTIPSKTSDLTNDSNFATSGYVDASVSGKTDTSAFTAHTSDTTIHVTTAQTAAWDAKQNALTIDSTVTSGSTNPVQGGAVYTQLGGLKLQKLTQTQYDALTTKDSNTLYVIVN